jgi:hypothetical protein
VTLLFVVLVQVGSLAVASLFSTAVHAVHVGRTTVALIVGQMTIAKVVLPTTA